MQERHKIIIDTNLWISFLLTKQFDFLDELLNAENITLVFSRELLGEFVGVVERPKFRKYFTRADLEHLLDTIDETAVYCDVISDVHVCRDEKDNFLLALAKDSEADYLITGDNDLLTLKQFEKTQIITIAIYKQMMKFL
jgi:putative PIN family toxin of toxin-antitoxin system